MTTVKSKIRNIGKHQNRYQPLHSNYKTVMEWRKLTNNKPVNRMTSFTAFNSVVTEGQHTSLAGPLPAGRSISFLRGGLFENFIKNCMSISFISIAGWNYLHFEEGCYCIMTVMRVKFGQVKRQYFFQWFSCITNECMQSVVVWPIKLYSTLFCSLVKKYFRIQCQRSTVHSQAWNSA